MLYSKRKKILPELLHRKLQPMYELLAIWVMNHVLYWTHCFSGYAHAWGVLGRFANSGLWVRELFKSLWVELDASQTLVHVDLQKQPFLYGISTNLGRFEGWHLVHYGVLVLLKSHLQVTIFGVSSMSFLPNNFDGHSSRI